MIQIKCIECGVINRLEKLSYKKIPYCGSCKVQLSEPFSVVAMRFLNGLKYWIILVAIGLGAFFIDGSKRESPSVPAPEVPVPRTTSVPSVQDQFTDQQVIVKPSRKSLEFIQGVNRVMVDAPRVAPFRIVTPSGQESYFVKLVEATTGREIMTINVHSGQSFETKVPLGRMKVRYATGVHWYGEEGNVLFGDGTNTSESDNVFNFKETAEGIAGYTIELIKQVNGNMHTRHIQRSQF